MTYEDMSRAVQSDQRVWPDDDLRDVAQDVIESNGTWVHADHEKLDEEIRDAMLNKYGTTRYCGPTRTNGIPYTTADLQYVGGLIKGAAVKLPSPVSIDESGTVTLSEESMREVARQMILKYGEAADQDALDDHLDIAIEQTVSDEQVEQIWNLYNTATVTITWPENV